MIVSKKRNKTEDIICSTLNLTFQHNMRKHISRCSKLIAYINFIRKCYVINFEHPINNFVKRLWSYGIWSDGIPNRSALQGPPLQSDKWHRFYRIKYFTNGRLRIDSFQPSSLLVVNDAIMGGFCKLLIISGLCF